MADEGRRGGHQVGDLGRQACALCPHPQVLGCRAPVHCSGSLAWAESGLASPQDFAGTSTRQQAAEPRGSIPKKPSIQSEHCQNSSQCPPPVTPQSHPPCLLAWARLSNPCGLSPREAELTLSPSLNVMLQVWT